MPTLNFKGKTAVENHHHTVPHHVLDIDKKLSLSKKPSLDDNLIVEGDNLLALKSLLPTHGGRIKCIYIDPPYNTGNEGWIYNDNLTQPQFKEWIGRTVGKEGEDATRHDKWCCMMLPRLQILRDLLSDDGVIVISIDDNELGHLRMLMDEVFGDENLVTSIAWQKKVSPSNDAKWFSSDHEFLIVYAKNKSSWRPSRLPRTADQTQYYKNPDNDPRGPWNSYAYAAGGKSKEERPNLYYAITNPTTRKKVWPKKTAVWAYSKEEHKRHIKENLLWWGRDSQARVPRFKKFLSEAGDIVPRSIWPYDDVGHTQEATIEFLSILPSGGFDSPKPSRLIARVIRVCTKPSEGAVVLDSFAGSGTTGHAVLTLNKEDGGNRKFILVQMPHDTKDDEKKKLNICRAITRERVRRVLEGYACKNNAGKRVNVPGLGGSFTYARVGKVLLDEHRGFSRGLPAFEDLARYIFHTETSQTLDPKAIDKKTGLIGEHGGTSFYLLYTPNGKADRCLDRAFLKSLKDKNPRKVVYCEKIWLHPDELREFGDVRAMLVPFNLK